MTKPTIVSLVVALFFGTSVDAQIDQCLELLRLSRTSSRTIMNESQFSEAKTHFCDEYQRSQTDGRDINIGVGYEKLSLSLGTSRSSADAVASKYCRFEDDNRQNTATFEEYLDGIDPGAFNAYTACTTARNNDVQFKLLTAPTRDVLELVVFHSTSVPNARAAMSWSASIPVTCHWQTADGAKGPSRRTELGANERTRLRCRRQSFSAAPNREPDFVNVIRHGGDATINIPWQKYNAQGEPIKTLEEMRVQLESDLANTTAALKDLQRKTAELGSNLDAFHSLNRLPLKTTVDAHPGYWGTWRKEFFCPEQHYVCGLQQRIEKKLGGPKLGAPNDDTAMNGLKMFCCPLFRN